MPFASSQIFQQVTEKLDPLGQRFPSVFGPRWSPAHEGAEAVAEGLHGELPHPAKPAGLPKSRGEQSILEEPDYGFQHLLGLLGVDDEASDAVLDQLGRRSWGADAGLRMEHGLEKDQPEALFARGHDEESAVPVERRQPFIVHAPREMHRASEAGRGALESRSVVAVARHDEPDPGAQREDARPHVDQKIVALVALRRREASYDEGERRSLTRDGSGGGFAHAQVADRYRAPREARIGGAKATQGVRGDREDAIRVVERAPLERAKRTPRFDAHEHDGQPRASAGQESRHGRQAEVKAHDLSGPSAAPDCTAKRQRKRARDKAELAPSRPDQSHTLSGVRPAGVAEREDTGGSERPA